MVDLVHQTITKSTKVAAADSNPLAWLGSLLITPADAGALERTAVLSPDGHWLYAVGAFDGPNGVSLVQLPDLKVKAKWLDDLALGTVWVSADGEAIYLLPRNGDDLRVLRTDGSQVAKLKLPTNTFGFIVPTIP